MRISDWSSDVCSSDLRFIFTGERTVHVDGNYAGTIVREKDGWRWMGNPRAFRTFTLAAQYVGEKYLRREEARRVRLEVQRSEEHPSELQSLMRISYAAFCLQKKKNNRTAIQHTAQREA